MSADDARRLLGGCAVTGPVLFTVAWLVAWTVQDDYSPRREDISALAAVDAQHAWIMIAGFLVLGLGTVSLGLGLAGAIEGTRSGRAGPVLLVLAGVGIAAAGVMRNDCSSELQACKDRVDAGDVSWHHTGHDVVSVAVFLLLVFAPLVLARAFRADERWRNLRLYSLVSAALTLALLLVFGATPFAGWNGLVQRVFVAVPLLWIVVLGTRLTRGASGRYSSNARPRRESSSIA